MRWVTTAEADGDIERLYRHGLEQFGAAQADRYLDGLYDIFDLLGRHPGIAPLRRSFSPPLRLHPYGRHLIVYREQDEAILIISIRHGRENWLGRLGDEHQSG